MLKAGDRIGDWIIESPLGEGGMGAVFRVHSALSERVDAALKVMKPSMEPDARTRFVREAEALAALRHPAIVRVMGFSEDSRRGLLYLVMELAEGETLKRRLEHGAMPLPEALATFVPLAAGLEHAHKAGISHRDLKPSNIILTLDGPVLVDFGIAAAEQSGELTGKGHLGTLSYLPPEVFRGERAEPRKIDVYGYGLLLNEALTAVHPFPVESGLTPAAALATVGMRKLQQPALDPGEGAPEPLRDLIRRATAPDPRQRPDMADIRRVLASLVERRGGAAASTTGAPAPARVPAWSPPPDSTMRVPDPVRPRAVTSGVQTTSHSRRRFRERRRSVIVAWAASVIAAALLTALVIMMMHGPRGRDESLSPEGVASPSASKGQARNPGADIKPVAPISPRTVSAPPTVIRTTTTTIPTTTTSTSTTTTTTLPARPSPAPRPSGPASPAAPAAAPRPVTSPRPSAPPPHPSPTATPPAEAPPPTEPAPTPSPSPVPSPSPPR
jgi:eukaryotic-like serine/threonine-protein kinase